MAKSKASTPCAAKGDTVAKVEAARVALGLPLTRNSRNQEMRRTHISEFTMNLDVAMFAALGDVDRLNTDSENDFFKKKGNAYRYAGLGVTIETLEPIFRKHGVMVLQGSTCADAMYEEGNAVKLYLTHEFRHVVTGEFRVHTLTLPLKSQDPQQLGSAITYGRRYLWQLTCGAIVEDDDANTAVFGQKSKQSQDKAGRKAKVPGNYAGPAKASASPPGQGSAATLGSPVAKHKGGVKVTGAKGKAKRPSKLPTPSTGGPESTFDVDPDE